jgi:hypothetical protein
LIALIGAFLLLAIWRVIQVHFKAKLASEIAIKRRDKGLLFVGLSIVVWSLSALLSILYYHFETNEWIKLISQNMFSILNSLFLILALYYFDNSPHYIYNNKKSTKRILLFFVLLSLLSLVLALVFGETMNNFGFRLNTIPDLILSAVLSWFLMISLFRTFHKRDLKSVAIIAVLAIALLFLAQIYLVFDLNEYHFYIDLIKIISKTTLIFVFLVLGTSWVLELAQLPQATTMKVDFVAWNKIELTVPSKNIINQTVDFGKKTTQFNNLLKFAIRRKYAPEEQMCIEVYNGGEILSQTYLTRILDNINSILLLQEDNKLQRNDFFTFIGNAKYSMRFLPEHISIDKALFQEFTGNVAEDIYREFKQ